MTNDDLIREAERYLNPRLVGDRLFGDVSAALVTPTGRVFPGACIDTTSGTGFCAEHSAIAAMVTAGEAPFRIEKIVAVWRGDDGKLFVVPPCGRCRELIRQVDEGNLDTEIVLGSNETMRLRELLPRHEWPEPLEQLIWTDSRIRTRVLGSSKSQRCLMRHRPRARSPCDSRDRCGRRAQYQARGYRREDDGGHQMPSGGMMPCVRMRKAL